LGLYFRGGCLREYAITIQSKVMANKKVKTTIQANDEKEAKKLFWKKHHIFKNNWRIFKIKEV